jgi:hypothetical protein
MDKHLKALTDHKRIPPTALSRPAASNRPNASFPSESFGFSDNRNLRQRPESHPQNACGRLSVSRIFVRGRTAPNDRTDDRLFMMKRSIPSMHEESRDAIRLLNSPEGIAGLSEKMPFLLQSLPRQGVSTIIPKSDVLRNAISTAACLDIDIMSRRISELNCQFPICFRIRRFHATTCV